LRESGLSKRIIGLLLVLAALGYAAYSGYKDGREHQATAQ
jgi:uncharacterized membrane protein YebE (DUF533 family)